MQFKRQRKRTSKVPSNIIFKSKILYPEEPDEKKTFRDVQTSSCCLYSSKKKNKMKGKLKI